MVTRRSGFTLAEVIVAMTLLCVAGLGVAATGLVAIQMFTRAEMDERALRAAETLLDSLLAQPANSAGTRVIAHARLSWNAADSTDAIIIQVARLGREPFELVGQR